MTLELTGIQRISVKPFKLGLLGGTFTVTELLSDKKQSQKACLENIQAIPVENWFVILADTRTSKQDLLARIDERYDLNFMAQGTFSREDAQEPLAEVLL